jgi:hypothetical protein
MMPDVTFNFTGPAAAAAAAASSTDDGGPALAAATEFARVDAFQWLIYD